MGSCCLYLEMGWVTVLCWYQTYQVVLPWSPARDSRALPGRGCLGAGSRGHGAWNQCGLCDGRITACRSQHSLLPFRSWRWQICDINQGCSSNTIRLPSGVLWVLGCDFCLDVFSSLPLIGKFKTKIKVKLFSPLAFWNCSLPLPHLWLHSL